MTSPLMHSPENRTPFSVGVYGFVAVWFPLAVVLSLSTALSATPSGRPVIAALAIVGVGSIAASCWLLREDRITLAGAMLVLSAVTPSVFVWVPNVIAFVLGAVLVSRGLRNR